MTRVQCNKEDCRRNLNGYCTLRKVLILNGKCQDYVKRKGQFGNITTTVYCDAYNCKYRVSGICTAKNITLKNGVCQTKVEVECNE